MLKKWIAWAVTLVMLLTVLPFEALAETEPTTLATEATQATESTAGQPAEEQPAAPEQTQEGEEKTEEEEEKPKLLPLSPAQAAIPTNKLPTKAARIQRLRYYIQFDHQNALEQEEAESLYGFCGLLASYQMYYRGINTWRRSADGKDNYDMYAAMSMTEGGYTIRAYNALKDPTPKTEDPEKTEDAAPETAAPAETAPTEVAPAQTAPEETVTTAPAEQTTEPTTAPEQTQQPPAAPEMPQEPEKYSIAHILNQITNYGSKEVYNLLVCFEKTDTAAGSIYGHVVFIYGIIDGVMYFTEGGDMFGVEAGQPMECTISQFSASYETWTDFEGVIVFGNKDYLDNCAVYTSTLFASCLEQTPLLPLPGQEEAAPLRTAAKGERLQVVGLYQNRDGGNYYEIYNEQAICYARAEQLKPFLYLYQPVTVKDPSMPQALKEGRDFRLDGTLESEGYISTVQVQVLDAQGTVVQEFTQQVEESRYDLYDWKLNQALDFAALPEGVYTCRVTAKSCNWHEYRGNLAKRFQKDTVLEQVFTVGEVEAPPAPVAREMEKQPPHGWVYQNQTWYCYDQGTPLTGWQRADGIWYYLQADGSVTTGMVLVEGALKLFTDTGAMRTGWADARIGRIYLNKDGSLAKGWMRIDGGYYYFNDMGVWQENYMKDTMDQMALIQDAPKQTEQLQEE